MTVLVADEHGVMRSGLRLLLERAGMEVVGEAANGHEVIADATRLRPAIVLMAVALPELDGIEATRILTASLPRTRVLGVSAFADPQHCCGMLAAGAAGYVPKSASSQELLHALATVARGGKYVSPLVTGQPAPPLTERECDVIELIASGRSSKEIATALGIAVPTVETHRRHLREKLDLRTIAELTKYAIRMGLTSVMG